MYAGERRDRIRDILYVRKNISVTELVDTLGVSSETVRRDLAYLEKEGFLSKTYGGATLSNNYYRKFSPAQQSQSLSEEMEAISSKAARFIENGNTIFVDQSATTRYLCEKIDQNNITVITNSLNVANTMAGRENITLILAGGFFDPRRNAFYGNNTIDCIRNFYIDHSFISPAGIDPDSGIYIRSEQEKNIRLAAIENSKKTTLLADHTKFAHHGKVVLLPDFSKIDNIITDGLVPFEWEEKLENKIIRAD